MNHIHRYFFILILFLSLLSCSTWGTKEWQALEDRYFHFDKFVFIDKMYNRSEAFAFMATVPVGTICRELEKTYALRVDSSAFESFIASGNIKGLTESGFLIKDTYTWQNMKLHDNRVELSLVSHVTSSGDHVKTYILDIISHGKVRKRFENDMERHGDLMPYLLRSIGRVDKIVTDKPVPEKSTEKSEPEKNDKIDDMLKNLSPEERDILRKKLEKQ